MSRDVIDAARKSAESAEAHPAIEAAHQRMARNFAVMDGSDEGYLAVLTGKSREELRALGLR